MISFILRICTTLTLITHYVAYIGIQIFVGRWNTFTHARRDLRCTLHPLIGLYLSLLPLIEVISWAIEARSLSPVIESSPVVDANGLAEPESVCVYCCVGHISSQRHKSR